MAKNKVKYGLKNVHYAPIEVGAGGIITFGTPVHIPGAVSLTLDPSVEKAEFEADNGIYWATYTASGYSGKLEMALIPDEFRKTILGDVEDETDHVLVEYINKEPKPFALLYEINGDIRASRRVQYYCTVGRPGVNASTTGKSTTPQTDSMDITILPLSDGQTGSRTAESTPDEVFSAWYTKVWEPKAIQAASLSAAAANNANLERTAAAQGVETMEV